MKCETDRAAVAGIELATFLYYGWVWLRKLCYKDVDGSKTCKLS